MAITLDGLLRLSRDEESRRRQEEQAQREKDRQERLQPFRQAIPKDVWVALGADPRDAKEVNGCLRLSLSVTVEGWTFPLMIDWRDSLNDFRCLIFSSPNCRTITRAHSNNPHENALGLSYALDEYKRSHVEYRAMGIEVLRQRIAQETCLPKLDELVDKVKALTNPEPEDLDDLLAEITDRRLVLSSQNLARMARAEVLIDLAKEYLEAERAYLAACRAWVEHWTNKLWRGWMLYEVRFAPIQSAQLPSPVIETVYTILSPNKFAGSSPARLLLVTRDGLLIPDAYIGSFLSGIPKTFEPSLTERLDFHRHYLAGPFVLNVPATVPDAPTDAPPAPLLGFWQWCADRGTVTSDCDPAVVATMSVNEALKLI